MSFKLPLAVTVPAAAAALSSDSDSDLEPEIRRGNSRATQPPGPRLTGSLP